VTDNINIQQTVNQVTVSNVGVQGPVGPAGSSASSVSSLVSANQGTTVSSSTSYMNFTGAVTATATGGSVTINVPVGGTASNATSLNGISGSAYALLAGSNFTGASVGGLSVATQNYVTGLGYQTSSGSVAYANNSGNALTTSQTNFNPLTISGSSVATQAYVTNQGFITSSGSVTYATNSGSSTYSSSAGAAPIPASVSYAASAGAAPIPASVSYSASAGTANNSINLGGQASTYYYPASSINAASVAYATNAGNALTTSQTNFATLTISSSNVATQAYVTSQGYLTSSGSIANSGNATTLGGQGSAYYYPASSITTASVAYATNAGSSNYSSSAGASPIPASVSYSASSGTSASLNNISASSYVQQSQLATASVAYAANSGTGGSSTPLVSANQGSIVSSSTTYINFTGGGVAASATGGSVTVTVTAGGTASNSASLGGISASAYALLAGANFTGASVGNLPVATQSFVTGQGYLISSGSIASASNSASLAGQPGSYYYPASSITVASVAYATNAGNSASTSQTNFGALTISGSSVATQNYVTGQGYLISSGSIASASNSASLGGIAANSYALLSGANFTTASINAGSISNVRFSGSLSGTLTNTGFISGGSANFITASINGVAITSGGATALTVQSNGINQTTTASILNFTGGGASVSGTSGSININIPTSSTAYAGYFYQTATVPLTIGTASAIPWNGSTFANGITFNGSSVTFTYPGYYSLNFGLQLNGSNSASINAWYRKNGVDVPNTNYESVVNNQTQYQLMQGVYTGSFSSGDIVQVMALTTGAVSSLLGQASSGTQPAAPAAILNISQVTYIQQGSSISGGSATNVTFTGGTANFNAASISGSALATQNFVTSQGYLISSGSILTASNSASLGGIPASSYAQLASANFTSASISGSALATQSFVNNRIYSQTIPFSVTGSVSAAGPWDYRFYNDTGGTRSINGVRASLGTAPSGSAMLIDVRKNGITGANSIFTASSISIPSGSITSGLISSGFNSGSSVASGDYLTVAITQVGSTVAGSDLVVQVMWS
jgi:trimeric autotransporter adhesin